VTSVERISLDGQVAVVTGAGQGLGAEYARQLAARGAAVVVNDLPGSERAAAVVAEIEAGGGRAIASLHDVAQREDARRIVADAVEHFGGVHVLVNNAGILRPGLFEDLTERAIASTLAVHLESMFHVTQPAWDVMREQGYGRIVNVSSTNAYGVEGLINYSAAKAGVIGFTHALALEAIRNDVLVNAVMPNAITEMAEQALTDNPIPRTLENTRFLDAYAAVGHCSEPARPGALVTYLASRECTVTGEVYSQVGPRYSRVFLGVADGWMSPEDRPPSAEDVAEHLPQIRDVEGFTIPTSVTDDFVAVVPRLAGAPSR
jgi:NAD(P)-dependent dehydrogenase (short-subunit alcohol dehydrogenase family)